MIGGGSRSVVSDSLRPHGLQSTRLLRPWDSPGKSTGVGCLFLLQMYDKDREMKFPTQRSIKNKKVNQKQQKKGNN